MTKKGWSWIPRSEKWHCFTIYGASLCGDWVIDRNDSIPGLSLVSESKCPICMEREDEAQMVGGGDE